MKKLILGGLAIFAMSLTACQKENDTQEVPLPGNVNSFEQLQVNNDFNWSTEAEYTLALKGNGNVPFAVKRKLIVKDLNDQTLAITLADMSQTRNFDFQAIAGLQTVKIQFGSIEKEATLNNGVFEFDFIPVDDMSDLDPNDL